MRKFVILFAMSSPPVDPPVNIETRIIAQLIVYSTTKDSKNKVKETKIPKVKELDFALSHDGYVDFLETILSKHSQDRFKVTKRRPYPFKYLYPPSKVYVMCHSLINAQYWHNSRVANAIDVEAKKDWYDMYNDISSNLPKKVKILIDLKAVKQACHLNVGILRVVHII